MRDVESLFIATLVTRSHTYHLFADCSSIWVTLIFTCGYIGSTVWTLCNPLVLKFGYSFFPLSLPPSLTPSLSFFCWRMFRNDGSMECSHFCSSTPLPESGQKQNIYSNFYTTHVFLAKHKFVLVFQLYPHYRLHTRYLTGGYYFEISPMSDSCIWLYI